MSCHLEVTMNLKMFSDLGLPPSDEAQVFESDNDWVLVTQRYLIT